MTLHHYAGTPGKGTRPWFACDSRQHLGIFLLLVAVYAGLSLLTLNLIPTVWQDEVELASAAQSAFPRAPYPATMELSDGSAPTMFTWAHSLVMRPFLVAFGLTPTAARLASLVGGLLAVILLRVVLSRLGVRPVIATVVSLLLLTDALFSGSLRGARADTWAFAWAFAAILLIITADQARSSAAHIACAGFCAVASLLTWPTAALLLPLVAASLTWKAEARSPRGLVRNSAILAVSGALALAIVALVSLGPDPETALLAIRRFSSVYGSDWSGPYAYVRSLLGSYVFQIWIPVVLAFSGGLVVAFPSWRGLTCLAAAVVAVVQVANSNPYLWRHLYAVPALLFCLAFGAEALAQLREKQGKMGLARVFAATLIVCLAGNSITEPGYRTFVGLTQRDAREYGNLASFIGKEVKPGERVFAVHSAYYAVEKANAHAVTAFYVVRTDGSTGHRYEAYEVVPHAGDYQILDADLDAIAFLGTLDVVVAPYETASASRLVSADETVRFEKVAELPPGPGYSRYPWYQRDYGVVLFRRVY